MICTAALIVLRFSDTEPLRTFWNTSLSQKIMTAVLVVVPILFIYVPPFNIAFGFAPIGFPSLLMSLLWGILPAAVYYVVKRFILTGDK